VSEPIRVPRLSPILISWVSSQPVRFVAVAPASTTFSIVGTPGPRGERGPDPWLDPVQVIAHEGGPLEIDYAAGKHVRLTMEGDVDELTVVNWPAENRIARLTLEVMSTGSFQVGEWPAGTLWPLGVAPVLTVGPGAHDLIILTTTDGGATILGCPVGYNFQ
jgi:hypothetical protein